MAKAPAPKPAIFLTRPKSRQEVFFTPPGLSGWANVIEPDDYQGDLKFKINHHYTPEQVALLIDKIEAKVIAPLWDRYLEEVEAAGKDPAKMKRPDAEQFVEDKLQQPAENARIQLPFMRYQSKAEFKDRKTGEMVRKTIKFYDAKDRLLDGPSLKMGMGSITQIMLVPGIFSNALIKAQPNFQLVGVRVLKLEQFGGGGAPTMEAADDEELKTLGDVDMDDLSQYVGTMNSSKGSAKGSTKAVTGDDYGGEDLDEEIPF